MSFEEASSTEEGLAGQGSTAASNCWPSHGCVRNQAGVVICCHIFHFLSPMKYFFGQRTMRGKAREVGRGGVGLNSEGLLLLDSL